MSQEQNKDMSQYFYRASAADFKKIPGAPVAYWISPEQLSMFDSHPTLSSTANVVEGSTTGDVNRFLRMWFEVSHNNVGLGFADKSEAAASNRKWFPYNKGGEYRKWYGNNLYTVNWKDDGAEIKDYSGSFVRGEKFYFKPGITWSKVSSGSLSFRMFNEGYLFDTGGLCAFASDPEYICAVLNSKAALGIMEILAPTLNFTVGTVSSIPIKKGLSGIFDLAKSLKIKSKIDWDSCEVSYDFASLPLLSLGCPLSEIKMSYQKLSAQYRETTQVVQQLEEKNNRIFIDAYGLQNELTPDVPLEEITLTCNPNYRYGGNKSEAELETLLQCDTLRELVSYAIGCMMGRYSLDKPGLILASQGETLQDYLRQIPSPRFVPDDDAILPLTDQEWFADDATNRFREFIRVVWGEEHLQQNLDFVAESLCLHAIKPKKGEASLDTIRRYLSTQFFKDHLRTYKKRPIYWLFSSGKHKAFECLVYLHRYNEGTLARMRTEYVIPLTAKLSTYAAKLEKDVEASTSTAEKKALEKELTTLHNQQAELATFDETLRHYADQRISLDLDDGVKVNYGKFGDLLAEVKTVTGDKE